MKTLSIQDSPDERGDQRGHYVLGPLLCRQAIEDLLPAVLLLLIDKSNI
jgi:hypothetical protein